MRKREIDIGRKRARDRENVRNRESERKRKREKEKERQKIRKGKKKETEKRNDERLFQVAFLQFFTNNAFFNINLGFLHKKIICTKICFRACKLCNNYFSLFLYFTLFLSKSCGTTLILDYSY